MIRAVISKLKDRNAHGFSVLANFVLQFCNLALEASYVGVYAAFSILKSASDGRFKVGQLARQGPKGIRVIFG